MGFFAGIRLWLAELNERFRAFIRRHMLPLVLAGLVTTFLAVYLANQIFIFVGSGQAGVLFHTLTTGTDTEHVYGEGMHVIWPWNQMFIYNMRVHERTEVVDALSSNGLTVRVTVSMRYFPEHKTLAILHQKVGPDYDTKIVVPEVTTGVREVIGKYLPEDLYTLKTSVISDAIIFSVARRVAEKFIVLDKVNVTNIKLPELVTTAIEKKLTQEQVSEEYKFRIDSQKQEKERLDYEAQGIANYNRQIEESLTPELLRYKGIDATLELARSNNAKIVVIGSGRDGLPLILNAESAASGWTGPAPAPKAPPDANAAAPAPSPRPTDSASPPTER
jgi:regulator of protease activity HflC (stomatin/prohibitin superfamily)